MGWLQDIGDAVRRRFALQPLPETYDRDAFTDALGLSKHALPEAGGNMEPGHRKTYDALLLRAAKQGDMRRLHYARLVYETFGESLLDERTAHDAMREAYFAKRYEALGVLAAFLPSNRMWLKESRHILTVAVEHGNREAVTQLLAAGIVPDVHYAEGYRILFEALKKDSKLLPLLLAHGADPNQRDNVGDTILAELVNKVTLQADDREAIFSLLAHGANPHIRCRHSPLNLAMALHHPGEEEVIGALIAYTTDLEIRDEDARTLFLNTAVMDGVSSLALVRSLGADIHAVDATGENAVRIAAMHQHDAMLPVLKEWGVDIDCYDHKGVSPLAAVALGSFDTAKQLVELGATDLHGALEALLSVDSDWPDAGEWDVNDPERERFATWLLEKGADIHAPCHDRESVFNQARQLAADYENTDFKPYMAHLILQWSDRFRQQYLRDAAGQPKALFKGDMLRDECTFSKQLLGAGILPEAFTPAHWQDRIAEAKQTIEALTKQLPPHQAQRCRELIDTNWMIETPPLENFTRRVQRPVLMPKER